MHNVQFLHEMCIMQEILAKGSDFFRRNTGKKKRCFREKYGGKAKSKKTGKKCSTRKVYQFLRIFLKKVPQVPKHITQKD
jgi:hypothetical protein